MKMNFLVDFKQVSDLKEDIKEALEDYFEVRSGDGKKFTVDDLCDIIDEQFKKIEDK